MNKASIAPKLRMVAVFAFLLFTAIFGYRTYIMKNSAPQAYTISKMECAKEYSYNGSSLNKKSRSAIWVDVNGNNYKVSGVTPEICVKYSTGDSIEVYYDSVLDVFFISTLVWLYGAFAVAVFFCLTFIKGIFQKSPPK